MTFVLTIKLRFKPEGDVVYDFIQKKRSESKCGRAVSCISFGEGRVLIVFVARNHACESTGSYVLEGVLDRLLDDPIPNIRVFCVPFVDYDDVLDGDQGKYRSPHDHNRDYLWQEEPIYPEVAEIRKQVKISPPFLTFDLSQGGFFYENSR